MQLPIGESQLKILLCAADSNERYPDAKAKLVALQIFDRVDAFDCSAGTPTLVFMQVGRSLIILTTSLIVILDLQFCDGVVVEPLFKCAASWQLISTMLLETVIFHFHFVVGRLVARWWFMSTHFSRLRRWVDV